MGESKALYSRLLAQPQRVIDRAVTPADLGRVLIRGVLPIVDEEIGSFDELRMAQILARDLSFPASQRAGVGLVIAAINHGHPVRLEPIAEGQGGVVQVMRGDLDIVDDERAFDKVVIANRGLKLIERDREIGVLHLPGQGFAQRLAEPLGSVDVPFAAGDKKRSKKRDALDVIPMGMADQHMPVQALCAVRDQLLTEGMCSGSAIQDNERSACRTYFDARRIAPVPHRARSGCGYRPAGTPEFYAHLCPRCPAYAGKLALARLHVFNARRKIWSTLAPRADPA